MSTRRRNLFGGGPLASVAEHHERRERDGRPFACAAYQKYRGEVRDRREFRCCVVTVGNAGPASVSESAQIVPIPLSEGAAAEHPVAVDTNDPVPVEASNGNYRAVVARTDDQTIGRGLNGVVLSPQDNIRDVVLRAESSGWSPIKLTLQLFVTPDSAAAAGEAAVWGVKAQKQFDVTGVRSPAVTSVELLDFRPIFGADRAVESTWNCHRTPISRAAWTGALGLFARMWWVIPAFRLQIPPPAEGPLFA